MIEAQTADRHFPIRCREFFPADISIVFCPQVVRHKVGRRNSQDEFTAKHGNAHAHEFEFTVYRVLFLHSQGGT